VYGLTFRRGRRRRSTERPAGGRAALTAFAGGP